MNKFDILILSAFEQKEYVKYLYLVFGRLICQAQF